LGLWSNSLPQYKYNASLGIVAAGFHCVVVLAESDNVNLFTLGDDTNKLTWIVGSVAEMVGNKLSKCRLKSLEVSRRSTASGCSACCETNPVNLRKRGCSLRESMCVYHARAAEGEVFGRFASHMISS
jgi:hypothetical protein